jgi:hypothetical protein
VTIGNETDEEPATVESIAGLAMANTELLGQAATIIGAQNCNLRALLRDMAGTDPTLLDRFALLAQPDLRRVSRACPEPSRRSWRASRAKRMRLGTDREGWRLK